MVVYPMPESTPPELPVDVERFKQWKPDAQQRALNLLRDAENTTWRPFYCRNRECNGQPHVWPDDQRECEGLYGHEWERIFHTWGCEKCGVTGVLIDEWEFRHARTDQRPPKWSDDWLTLLLRGGRGSGKTKSGSEITTKVTKIVPRIILIASTGPDLRDTMVEGVSGILACSPPGERPVWEPSKKRLTWPNGCIGQGFSAEEPDRLRGPQSGFVWGDEPGHWDLVEDVWSNMLFGLRLKGKNNLPPKVIATSTPKPTKWMKALVKAKDTIDRTVSTYANMSNLAPTFRKTVLEKYEGTRLGRQELYGELLEDVEGALWNWDMIHWVEEAPALLRIVVAVDPAGTANKKSDETGIIVLGIGHDKKVYVLADLTGKYSPSGWANKVLDAVDDYSADAIVVEKNFGEDMVNYVLDTEADRRKDMVKVIGVRSRRGKDIRAEPVVALYEKQRVLHVGQRGDLAKLEEEQTMWVPGEGASPNRVDALVHGITEVGKGAQASAFASPSQLTGRYSSPTNRHLRAI
jgi:phage terminase large subunit-like protein